MYHPLVYMTTECRHHRTRQCQNRTCAFYHSEGQRKEAEENREELLIELAETERRLKEEGPKLSSDLDVDIDSSNHFPSLQDSESTSKQNNSVKRSFADTIKSSNSPILEASSPPNLLKSSTSAIDTWELTPAESAESPLLTSLNDTSIPYSPRSLSGIDLTTAGFNAANQTGSSSGVKFDAFSSAADFGFSTTTASSSTNDHSTNDTSSAFNNQTPPFTFLDQGGLSLGSSGVGSPYSAPFSDFSLTTREQGFNRILPISESIEPINDNLKVWTKPISVEYHRAIYEGVWSDFDLNEERVIVKEIDLTRCDNRLRVLEYVNRIESLYHKNLIRIRGVISWADRVFIVTDYYNNDDTLTSYIEKYHDTLVDSSTGELTSLCISFIVQICSLLEYLNRERMVHRDLKPNNIYVNLKKDNNHQLILGDFKYSQNINQGDAYHNSNVWEAPEERLRFLELYPQGDMWRLGVLIFYIISGKEPDFNSQNYGYTLLEQVPYWHSLISMLLQRDHLKRLTAEKLTDHPVFWNSSPGRILRFLSSAVKLSCQPTLGHMCASLAPIDWFSRPSWKSSLPPEIYEIIPDYNSYEGTSVPDLLRVIGISLKQIQQKSPDNDKIESLRKRALSLLTSSSSRHPILYYHELYPRLVLRLWGILYIRDQEAQIQIQKLTDILATTGDLKSF